MSAKRGEHKDNEVGSPVDASPTKRFFVEMLVRDIPLVEAVLDLLDNCIDGILRTHKGAADNDHPYRGFWAHINFGEKSFRIVDNCGGISRKIALGYAFRMGSPDTERDKNLPTIGMYGIGMKRAFFKMGRSIKVRSQHRNDRYEVSISSRWLDSDDWHLPISDNIKRFKKDGTEIEVTKLYEPISKEFGSIGSDFRTNLEKAIGQYYSLIIQKGFEVRVNGDLVKHKPFELLLGNVASSPNKPVVAPYLYRGTRDGVKIELAVGLYRAPPGAEELEEETKSKRSKVAAGWTIICNDRVVAHCDRSELTGWGVSDVPAFHNQFNAIAGTVHFRSNDSWKLPLTTTKRGADANSKIYLYVRGFMMEGMKKFTSYTNKWKNHIKIEREISGAATSVSVEDIATKIPSSLWKRVKGSATERKFIPNLPAPKKSKESEQIVFFKPTKDVCLVSEYLFDKSDEKPGDVGAACFDKVLREAKK